MTCKTDNTSTGSDASADSALTQEGMVDALIKLMGKGQSLDSNLSVQLEPINRRLLAELNPRDAMERMLAAQIVATFGRSMYLTRHANRQTNSKWFALYSRECDRAMNLCRKQMQTLADYRRPRRSTFTAIRNANIAGQQVITTAPFPAQEQVDEARMTMAGSDGE